MSTLVGSILHGAYADYYEQALCLKDLALANPDWRFKLFFAEENRLSELEVLDFSFAEGCYFWPEITEHPVDRFIVYQVCDAELKADVLAHLPAEILARIDREHNLLPWRRLRRIMPLKPANQIELNELGRSRLPMAMAENHLSEEIFDRPTVGFQWRYRTNPHGTLRPWLQPSAESLRLKYSRVFQRLIDETDAVVLIAGMAPVTEANRHRVDAKMAPFQLDLPPDRAFHLSGAGWALELEIMSRVDVALTHASGFSEGMYLKRGGGVILVDPPVHYLLKMVRHRMPNYDFNRPRAFWRAWAQPHTEARIYRWLRSALDQAGRA